jgi:hypothetical protein
MLIAFNLQEKIGLEEENAMVMVTQNNGCLYRCAGMYRLLQRELYYRPLVKKGFYVQY